MDVWDWGYEYEREDCSFKDPDKQQFIKILEILGFMLTEDSPMFNSIAGASDLLPDGHDTFIRFNGMCFDFRGPCFIA